MKLNDADYSDIDQQFLDIKTVAYLNVIDVKIRSSEEVSR